jgi:transcriptional regulator with XRE-family HTH domain
MTETAARQNVSKRIRMYRAALDWSQEDLARHAKLAQPTISQIERGTKNPSLSSLIAICNALKIPLKAIFEEFEIEGRSVVSRMVRLK